VDSRHNSEPNQNGEILDLLRLMAGAEDRASLSGSLGNVAKMAAVLTKATQAGVFLMDSQTRDLRLVASHGIDMDTSSQVTSLPLESMPWTADKKTRFIPRGEVSKDVADVPEAFKGGSFWVPLFASGEIVGRLVIKGAWEEEPNKTAQEFLRLVSVYAGSIIANTRLYDALQRRLDELTTLFQVGKALSSTLELDRVLKIIVEGVANLTGVRSCSIMLLDHAGEKLKIRMAKGLPEEVVKTAVRKLGEGISGRVAQTGKPIYLRNTREAEGVDLCNSTRYKSPSLICVPLKSRSRVIGVLNANDKRSGDFVPEDLNLITLFANQAAVAIDNAAMHDRLWRTSVTDGLTKTYVHTYFEKQLQRKVETALSTKEKLALIMLDLDHFKDVNDQFGHQVGDDVLRQVARLLRRAVRSNDLVARYGGEEFVLILSDVPARIAMAVTKRLHGAVRKCRFSVVKEGVEGETSVTASFGLAMLPYDTVDAKDIVKKADEFLYQSKDSGRDRITCSDTVMAKIEEEEREKAKAGAEEDTDG